jgi:hypothetical protein
VILLPMNVIDYNGEGRWNRAEILARYSRYVTELGIVSRNLSPTEHTERGRRWVYLVKMLKVIEGIEAGNPACIRIGIEFIEEDAKFPFGKILKSNTAHGLRRTSLSDDQKRRVRRRVFGLLQAGHIPHEYREYAKLVRKFGFDVSEVPDIVPSDPYAVRFQKYFEKASRLSN